MEAVLITIGPHGKPELRLEHNAPCPEPLPGEVLIRTTAAGICNTDLEIMRGYAGFTGIPGHEFVGVVERAEDTALIGQRVVGEINIACQTCPTCQAGRTTHCPSRTVLGIRGRAGVLAEAFSLPARNLHQVPEGMPDEAALFTEPLAAACQVLDQVHVRPTSRVIVLGDGKLGHLVAQVLSLTGCALTVVGRHARKLKLLTERGIDAQLVDSNLDGSADIVVECTGRPEGFRTAQRLVRPAGTIALKSTYHQLVQTDLSQLVVDEVKVVGSRCGPFPAALRLLERGDVVVAQLIEAEYHLAEAEAAFEHAARPGALKVIIKV